MCIASYKKLQRVMDIRYSGRIQNFFAMGGGGGGGGAKGRGVNNHGLGVATQYSAKERKMSRVLHGASPQPLFTVIMLLRRVFVVFISSARHKTPPLVAMNI